MNRHSILAGLVMPALLAAAVSAQPQFVVEVNPGSASAAPRELRVFRGELYFTASRPDVGRELFHFDGQVAALASDIAGARAAGSDPASYVLHQGALYFVARNSLGFNGLWRFDGRKTDLIFAGSDVSYPVSYGGRLFFVAESMTAPRVWYWDGRDNFVVNEIPESPYPPRHLTVFRGQLYFSYNDGMGRELWRFDGQRMERATEVNAATQEVGERGVGLDFRTLRVYQGLLYFTAPDLVFYHFDGTQAVRVLGRDKPGEWVGSHGGLVFFRTLRQVTVSASVPDTLWAYDRVAPRPLLPLFGAARLEVGYDRQAFVPFKGRLYYRSLQHLWRFTGRAFERVSDGAFYGDALPGGMMAAYKGRLYVAMPYQQDGNDELFRYDGAGPVFAARDALSNVAFDAPLLDAEASALEAGIDLTELTAADDPATPRFLAVLASANPTRGAVAVRVSLPEAAEVRATVHDALGRPVATLHDGAMTSGVMTLTWDADVASGVYAVRIAAGRSVQRVPVVVAR